MKIIANIMIDGTTHSISRDLPGHVDVNALVNDIEETIEMHVCPVCLGEAPEESAEAV